MWAIVRYSLVSVTVMIATLSAVTGQFPPSFGQLQRTMESTKKLVDVGSTLEKIEKAGKERQKVFEDIAQQDASFRNPASASGAHPAAPSADSERKIKALEYEVALLKSKLYRAEAEADELKTLLQQASHAPAQTHQPTAQQNRQPASKQ